VTVGKVKVDRRLFQIVVTEQHLDSAQVSPRFEEMCGKAVAKRVRVYPFVETRA
jgi:hypothetical protein